MQNGLQTRSCDKYVLVPHERLELYFIKPLKDFLAIQKEDNFSPRSRELKNVNETNETLLVGVSNGCLIL